MGKRVRISNDSLNSYGTRVLTAGMNVEQYQRNPVLLYMHERGEVIGYVKDLRVEDNEVTGELMFDCATELSRQCKKQWEFGSLKMVSAGLDVLELSEDKSLLIEGQTRPTITKSKLFEVSLVDIGSNDDAIVLCREGRRITPGSEGANSLPLLSNNNNIQTKQTTTHMEQTALALQLGLKPDASEADIMACLTSLKAAKEENAKLVKEQATLRLAAVTAAVDKALGEHRFAPERREEFITLGGEIGTERLERLFSAMAPQVKLSQLVHTHEGNGTQGTKKYTRLGEVPTDELLKMRSEDRAEYCRLYRAEYGVECEL